MVRTLVVLVAAAWWVLAPPAAAAGKPAELAEAQRLIDAGRPLEVLHLLAPLTEGKTPSAEALLLESTARFMLGDVDKGREELEKALKIDPKLRQGWLNLGALHVADQEYGKALAAFDKARALDPKASDNDLNLGAVQLLLGKLPEAQERFAAYLAQADRGTPDQAAEAHYLVAANYAVAGYAQLTVTELENAFRFDERLRLRARTDATFDDLRGDARYQRLLQTEFPRTGKDVLTARRSFDASYAGGEGRLLGAVLDALQESGIPFDSRVEVTPGWALVWGAMRIDVRDADGGGVVEMSAPAGSLTPSQWQQRTTDLFARIAGRLAS
ncbi:MAG: hypothetical protein KDD11_08295 [Acidobacteria bacterium]|nr:hypothetical protein [Acidobacteriota bacterium]